jgi:hypothetical protein
MYRLRLESDDVLVITFSANTPEVMVRRQCLTAARSTGLPAERILPLREGATIKGTIKIEQSKQEEVTA